MPKLNKIQKIIISGIALVVVFSMILRASGNYNSSLSYDAFSMIKYGIIDYPVQTITRWTSDLGSLWAVKEENDLIKHELSKTPYYKASLDEEKRKNAELQALLQIENDDEMFARINARVIGRDQAYWNNKITIDKGSSAGIVENMAVESVKGVVGKVESVSEFTSVVKLLTSQDKLNSASIQVSISSTKSIEGILQSYDPDKKLYVVLLFEESDEIKKGMPIVTSGKGGVYPSGLFVGNVVSVQTLTNQKGQTVYAQPVDDFQSFDYVSVVGANK